MTDVIDGVATESEERASKHDALMGKLYQSVYETYNVLREMEVIGKMEVPETLWPHLKESFSPLDEAIFYEVVDSVAKKLARLRRAAPADVVDACKQYRKLLQYTGSHP